jgi:hypothetical protein
MGIVRWMNGEPSRRCCMCDAGAAPPSAREITPSGTCKLKGRTKRLADTRKFLMPPPVALRAPTSPKFVLALRAARKWGR